MTINRTPTPTPAPAQEEAAQIKPINKLMSWKERNAQLAAEKAAKRAQGRDDYAAKYGDAALAMLDGDDDSEPLERELCPHEIEQAERNAESKAWAANQINLRIHDGRIHHRRAGYAMEKERYTSDRKLIVN